MTCLPAQIVQSVMAEISEHSLVVFVTSLVHWPGAQRLSSQQSRPLRSALQIRQLSVFFQTLSTESQHYNYSSLLDMYSCRYLLDDCFDDSGCLGQGFSLLFFFRFLFFFQLCILSQLFSDLYSVC